MKSLQNPILSLKAFRLCFCEVVVMENTKSISGTLFLATLKITTKKITCDWDVPHVHCSQHVRAHCVAGQTLCLKYLSGW